jgi:hypothetical protein
MQILSENNRNKKKLLTKVLLLQTNHLPLPMFWSCVTLSKPSGQGKERLSIPEHTEIKRVMYFQVYFLVTSMRVKRPGCEADHAPPSRVDVKNSCSYTSTPQYAFIAWCSVKVWGQLYFKLRWSAPLALWTYVLSSLQCHTNHKSTHPHHCSDHAHTHCLLLPKCDL